VIEEADDGKRRGVLVPVLLDSVDQPRGFREIQAADLTGWQAGHPSARFDELIKDIRSLLDNAPRRKTAEPLAVQRARDDRIVQGTANAYSKRFVLLVAAVAGVAAVGLMSYLSFRGPNTDVPISPPTSTQELKPEPLREERKAETEPQPPAVASRNVVKKQSEPEPSSLFALRAVINDPDGYTNVRRMQSAASDILTKVYEGEQFYTYAQDDNWWRIKTKDGKIGYMHVSRIRLLK
jgi:hypothetical protein